MRKEMQATTLENVISNLKPYELKLGSKFYVDLDKARYGTNVKAPRNRIIRLMKINAMTSDNTPDESNFFHFLLSGHRSCGKTTELCIISEELQKEYYNIFVTDIDKKIEYISNQKDFLYFVISQLVAVCNNEQIFKDAVGKEVQLLYGYLTKKIFGVETETHQLIEDIEIEANNSTSVSVYFSPVLKIMAKLIIKGTFAEETQKTLNLSIKNYFYEFVEIANSIITKMQEAYLRYKGKRLLLILDGLDKVRYELAEKVFLDGPSFLVQLKTDMIVTFPICLLYSPKKDEAIIGFDQEIFILSMIKVHNRDGSDFEQGMNALREVLSKRMDIYALMENPNEDLNKAIRLSGGNIRDLFSFVSNAALTALLDNSDKIKAEYLEYSYQEKKSNFHRKLVVSYLPYLKKVLNDVDKEKILRETPTDDTFLNMFDAGLLIEYNGERWCDLNPLVKEIVEKLQRDDKQ